MLNNIRKIAEYMKAKKIDKTASGLAKHIRRRNNNPATRSLNLTGDKNVGYTSHVNLVASGSKFYKIQYGVGKAKYLVSFHDGVKKHKDGSDFYDAKIFKNKKDLDIFEQSLLREGYKYKN